MIYQILKRYGATGIHNAMTTRQLMEITGMPKRAIIKDVNTERKKHFICSRMTAGGGYYRPATMREIMQYIAAQERRIATHAVSLRLARRFKKRRERTE